MKHITLTEEQASELRFYIDITACHRKAELEASARLAEELSEDGTIKFPNMASNAEWWKQEEVKLQAIVAHITPEYLK